MWDRRILKNNAKIAIGGKRFWICVAVSLTMLLVPYLLGEYSSNANNSFIEALTNGQEPDFSALFLPNTSMTLFGIFVMTPLGVGMTRFFVQNRFGNTRYANVFSGFSNGYLNTVGTMFVTELFICLWMLLFFIPGIVKGLQYSMVQFLLSDNPNLNGSRARQISRLMTDGEKGAIFVLGLSFLGWFLLPSLAGVILAMIFPFATWLTTLVILIGTLLIMPYYYATLAELYVFLRDRAIQAGMVSPEELNLAPVSAAQE